MSPAQQVRLRKCGEHDDCQLQKVNDGEWEHTPAATPAIDRFGYLSAEQRTQLEQIAHAMHTAQQHKKWSEETALRLAGLEARLEGRVTTLEETLLPLAERMEAAPA